MKLQEILFASDLDGTLLNRQAALSRRSAEIINQLIGQGLIFSIATARSWNSAQPLVQGLQLRAPAVTYNGAFLLEPATGRVLAQESFLPEEIDRLAALFGKHGIYPMSYSRLEGRDRVSYLVGKETPGIRKYLDSRRNSPRLRPVKDEKDLTAGEVFYFTAIGTEEELLPVSQVLCGLSGFTVNFQADVYDPREYWLEIMPQKATKAHGVSRVKEMLGVKKVVCFGDNVNDIPMFQFADEAYATANSSPALQKLATDVIGHCDQDGVALFLEQYCRELL